MVPMEAGVAPVPMQLIFPMPWAAEMVTMPRTA